MQHFQNNVPQLEIMFITRKSLSVSVVHCAIYQHRLKLYHAKKRPHVSMIQKCCCDLF